MRHRAANIREHGRGCGSSAYTKLSVPRQWDWRWLVRSVQALSQARCAVRHAPPQDGLQ